MLSNNMFNEIYDWTINPFINGVYSSAQADVIKFAMKKLKGKKKSNKKKKKEN